VRSGDVLKANFVECPKLHIITLKIRPGSVTALRKKNRFSGRSTEKRTPILYGSEFALLQFMGQGQVLGVGVCLRNSFGRRFGLVSMVSINLRIRFYEVETGNIGESIEPEEKPLNTRVSDKGKKTKLGT
jgi:hypothetical protein